MPSAKRNMKSRKKEDTRADLRSWKEIAGFLGQPVSVAQRWAKAGMPVAKNGRFVTASVKELTQWLARVSGLPGPAHIATDDQDLSKYLKAGLTEIRKSKQRDGKRAA